MAKKRVAPKITVPEGMLIASWTATLAKMKEHIESGRGDSVAELHVARIAVEAALRCLSENPIVPTGDQAMRLRDIAIEVSARYGTKLPTGASESAVAVAWQSCMFLAPEPEVPEELKDLLVNPVIGMVNGDQVNDRIKQAYRRGQKSGSK
jgi:hypothetical protein